MKLRVRVNRAPVSIFEMIDGEKEVDRTGYYEHGWDDPEHLFWCVPDGQYMVCQGDKPPCIYTVKDGEVHTIERNGKPAGNNVEESVSKTVKMSSPGMKAKAGKLGALGAANNGKKTKNHDIVIELVDTGEETEKP